LHEFFGIAVVEAIYCGCFPILPRRLAYPERLPAQHKPLCLYDGSIEGLLERLRWALTHIEQTRSVSSELRAHVAALDWRRVAPGYDAALEEMIKV
jgi:hypothetical protein